MTQTLLIDNYDSFTYNLYALIAETSGVPPLVVRNDERDWDSIEQLDVSRIVISPGPGRPQRRTDLGLSAQAILQGNVPVLGVCLGHQAIAHCFGGRVDLAPEPVHGRLCQVSHAGTDLFANLPSPFAAVRYHSLAVCDLPEELEATAWAEDGVLMALRHRSRPLWGVQFHPESICTEYGAALMQRFFQLSAPRGRTLPPKAPAGAARTEHANPVSGTVPEPPSLRVYAFAVQAAVQPQVAFAELYGQDEFAFWLDSSMHTGEIGRFSYMGDVSGPRAELVRYRARSQTLEILSRAQRIERTGDVLSYLQTQLARRACLVPEVELDFVGGYVGYFGYELLESSSAEALAESPTPDAYWMFCDRLIGFDHLTGRIWVLCLDEAGGLGAENERWVQETQTALLSACKGGAAGNGLAGNGTASLQDLRWRHSPSEYRDLIRRALMYIREGESYEVCLTNQITAQCDLDALSTYLALRRVNPAPQAAFVKFGPLSILCASPELFLKVSHDGVVESKPIKGTAPREADRQADQQRAAELAASIKNRSENLMIVDLLRNDLNRVCEVGSVHVPKLFAVESYASVHQLVSTIRGKLRSDATVLDCVRASFPGGSMTGAPKVRTVAILKQLEQGARGIYSGSLGYLSVTGSAQLNIVIRTVVLDGTRLSVGTGGAIVALSDPIEEFAEIVLKVRALLEVASGDEFNASCDVALADTAQRERHQTEA